MEFNLDNVMNAATVDSLWTAALKCEKLGLININHRDRTFMITELGIEIFAFIIAAAGTIRQMIEEDNA